MKPASPLVSIVIATRNRKVDLLRALESCFAQSYGPLELLVFDDASDDGTESAVREAFPAVRYFRQLESIGQVSLRNRGFQEARGRYVFSIDDDAYFSDRSIVSAVVEFFESAPETVAVVAIPFVEPRPSNSWHGVAGVYDPTKNGARELRSFVGCAHALRREPVVKLDGYRSCFGFGQGEERDLAIRLMQAGFSIVSVPTKPIVHVPNPTRDLARLAFYSVRNTLLFDFLYVPTLLLIPRFLSDTVRLVLYKFTFRTAVTRARHAITSLGTCVKHFRLRRPVFAGDVSSLSSPGTPRSGYCEPAELPSPARRVTTDNAPPIAALETSGPSKSSTEMQDTPC